LVVDMAKASEQQAAGIKQISSAVSDMDTVTQKNAAMVEQNEEVARSLTQQTGALANMVAFFAVGGASRAAAAPIPRRTAA
jgi:methyl-accepting chemotaxis protein